jgi:predicted DNA-binding transcriptional regulator YafY
MSFDTYANRLNRMDYLIRSQATGSPREFSLKLDVCVSTLMEYLKLMKEMGAEIRYDKAIGSYYYEADCELIIGFV